MEAAAKPADDAPSVAAVIVTPPKRKLLTIEPAVLLLFTSFSLCSTVWTNQIIFQTCTVQFGYSDEDCGQLGTHNASKEIETIVQPYAANILVARNLIESIGPGLMSLFLGPWSDRFGRRPVVIASLIGYILTNCMSVSIAWLSTMHAINPWAYVLASMPVALSGGLCAFLMCSYCYISDVTTTENRALRMSIMMGMMFVGGLVGNLASSPLYIATGTSGVFAVATVLSVLSAAYVIAYVDESIQNSAAYRRIGRLAKFGALFDVSLVSDMFATLVRRRDHYERPVIWLTMLTLISGVFVLTGSDTVFYMFVRAKFSWTIQQYNVYDSTSIVTQVFGNVFGIYVLIKYFGIGNSSMAILAYLSFAADYAIKAMASEPWHLYAAIGVAFMRFVSSPMCRTILADSVPANEIGKIYALTTCIEWMSALVAAPLYTYVYDTTLSFYPGAFNLISAAVCLFCVFLLMLVKIVQKRNPPMADSISYGPIIE